MLLKQTKIVATISDQRCEVDFIKQLFEAGMNMVRMNTAHLGREGAEKLINNVRTVSNRIAILMDTKGPEVRTTVLAEPISFKVGDRVKVVGRPEQETTRECISVSYPDFVRDLNVGGQILIDDGDLELAVIEKCDDYLLCEVQNEASLGSRKSVNVPGVRINLPSLTEKDRNNILYAIEKDIDFIAHSFVRNKQDVLDIKEILDAHGSDIRIIAKIENQEGVDNIDEILEVADGVMIARGDLGIEVPQERIPGIQRILIRKCILAKKPVIVATQMLHTMINNPRPTRAEGTDIANANRHRQCHLLPHRCLDAEWRDSIRQISGRSCKDHDESCCTGRKRQTARQRHPYTARRKQQRRDSFPCQAGGKSHYKAENPRHHYRQLQRTYSTQSGCFPW